MDAIVLKLYLLDSKPIVYTLLLFVRFTCIILYKQISYIPSYCFLSGFKVVPPNNLKVCNEIWYIASSCGKVAFKERALKYSFGFMIPSLPPNRLHHVLFLQIHSTD